MDNSKKIRSCKRGMANLRNKILPLRGRLRELEQAWLFLEKTKYQAELAQTEVKHIPTHTKGGGKKSLKNERDELLARIALLEKKLERKET